MPVCNRENSLQAASLDAAVLNGRRFKLRIGFVSVLRPHLSLHSSGGRFFVAVSLLLAARCGEGNHSPQQSEGINTLLCRNCEMSCDAAHSCRNECMSLREAASLPVLQDHWSCTMINTPVKTSGEESAFTFYRRGS